ncbi:MAG: response regulator [Gammaproteobacteria bacterium]
MSAEPQLVAREIEPYLNSRVLVVDDQPANVLLLRKMLGAAGYQSVATTTDPTAVRGLHRAEPFDIILLDIRMPRLDGHGVMAQLQEDARASGDYVPVLVLTAQEDEETRLKALAAGAKDFVTKPFNRTEVLNRIRNMLEVRLLHKAVRQQNEVLEQRVRERTAELRETRLEIIRRLGLAAEYRDNETGLHIVRMSRFSQVLARAAGFDEYQAELILNASPMHDIGKLGIPDRILLKPGRLDEEEWAVMQTHVHIGARILDGHPSELMQMAARIARHHHERWDGTGYPHGLAGEAIPIEARIVAVADVFDALTSRRPYKEAWPVETAVAELHRIAGSHLDPTLVNLFVSRLPEILDIKQQHAEPA